jgi:hypothetical protein
VSFFAGPNNLTISEAGHPSAPENMAGKSFCEEKQRIPASRNNGSYNTREKK